MSIATSVAWGVGATVVALDFGFIRSGWDSLRTGEREFWNPVGWGLLALSLITGIFGYSKKREMEEKLRAAKAEARSKLLKAVDDAQHEINRALDKYTQSGPSFGSERTC